MKTQDIMRRDPIVVRPSDPLHLARSVMAWMQIRHLPVVRDGRLVGILTDHDLLAYGARAETADWSSHPVDQAMHREPQTASPGHTVSELARMFVRSALGAAPVVDERKNAVGIVSYLDLLKVLSA